MSRKYRRRSKKSKLTGEILYWLIVLTMFAYFTRGSDTKWFFIKGIIGILGCVGVYFGIKYLIHSNKKKRYLSSALSKVDVMSGEEFEGFLKAHFEKLGYKVKLTPKTADYGADLILTKGKEKIAVQAKRYSDKVSNKAVQEVVGAIPYYDKACTGMKGMVITNSYFTANAVTQARACGVTLWDRDDLRKKFGL